MPARTMSKPEVVHRERRLTASFTHWYFPSAPACAAQLFLP
jgi:cobyrinic acid a,c-diamide synthase